MIKSELGRRGPLDEGSEVSAYIAFTVTGNEYVVVIDNQVVAGDEVGFGLGRKWVERPKD